MMKLGPFKHRNQDMDDVLSRPDLRAEADRDLARRSIAGVFSYFILWLIIYLTRQHEINRILMEFLGFILAGIAVGRLYLALRFDELYAAGIRRWRFLFSSGTILSALAWGGVCVLTLYINELGPASVMVLLATAGIAAGGIVTMAGLSVAAYHPIHPYDRIRPGKSGYLADHRLSFFHAVHVASAAYRILAGPCLAG
jgi:hypothetical protein